MFVASRATLRASSRALSTHARLPVGATSQASTLQQARSLSQAPIARATAAASADSSEGYSVSDESLDSRIAEEEGFSNSSEASAFLDQLRNSGMYDALKRSEEAEKQYNDLQSQYNTLLDLAKQVKNKGDVGAKDGKVFTGRKPSPEESAALARALPKDLLTLERAVRKAGVLKHQLAEEISSHSEDDAELLHDVVTTTLPYLPVLDLQLFTKIIAEKINVIRNADRYDENGLPPAIRNQDGEVVDYDRTDIPGADPDIKPYVIDFQYDDAKDNQTVATYLPESLDPVHLLGNTTRYDALIAKVNELGSDVKLVDIARALSPASEDELRTLSDEQVIEQAFGPAQAIIRNFALSQEGRDALLSWHNDVHSVIDHLDQSLTYPADKFNDFVAQTIEETATGDLQQFEDRSLNSQESAGLFVLAGIIGGGIFLGQAVKRATHAGHPSSANHGHH